MMRQRHGDGDLLYLEYTCAPRTGHASLSGSLSQILFSTAVYPGPRSSFMRVATPCSPCSFNFCGCVTTLMDRVPSATVVAEGANSTGTGDYSEYPESFTVHSTANQKRNWSFRGDVMRPSGARRCPSSSVVLTSKF
jgi:hypothetical protein